MFFRTLVVFLFCIAFTSEMTGNIAIAEDKTIIIGTAGELGVYYPAGGAICRLVGRGFKEHGIHCEVKRTEGSVYNLEALKHGDIQLGLSQADWVYHAYNGTRNFAVPGEDKSLRTLFSLHTEAFTVLVRADSGIKTIDDLIGKSIGIRDDASGMRATAEEFFKAKGWNADTFSSLQILKSGEETKALCSGDVQVILFTTGHPNGKTQEITHDCATHLIAVDAKTLKKLVQANSYYQYTTIPGGMYPGSPEAIATFGVKAELMTSAKVPDDIIYEVVKVIFTNLDNFKTLHPVFADLDPKIMVSEGIIAPLHPGALRYYKEVGLIP